MRLATLCIFSCLILGSNGGLFMDAFLDTFTNIKDAFITTTQGLGQQASTLANQLLTTASQSGSLILNQALQVATLGASGQSSSKRDIHDLLSKYSQLKTEIDQLIHWRLGNMQGSFDEAISKLQLVPGKILDVPVEQLQAEIKHIVDTHNGLSQALTNDLVARLVNVFERALAQQHHTRSLTDTLNSLGQSISSFFAPHQALLNQLVSGVGDSLSQGLSNFTSAVQNSQHSQAVSESAHAVVNHGINALNSLKDSVTDIFQNTLTNMQPHLINILNQGASALTEALNTGTANQVEPQ